MQLLILVFNLCLEVRRTSAFVRESTCVLIAASTSDAAKESNETDRPEEQTIDEERYCDLHARERERLQMDLEEDAKEEAQRSGGATAGFNHDDVKAAAASTSDSSSDDDLHIALGMPIGPVSGKRKLSSLLIFKLLPFAPRSAETSLVAEREKIPAALADRDAALRPAAVVSGAEDRRLERADSRLVLVRIPRGRLGQAAGGRVRQATVRRCVRH